MDLEEPARLVEEGMVSVVEAAAFSGISRSELYVRMARGELKFLKIGKRRLIPRRSLVAMLARYAVAREE